MNAPHPGWQRPAQYVQPHPYPQAPPARPAPIQHFVVWPAVALTVVAGVIALTARVIDYQTVMVFGVLAAAASIAATVVGARRSVPWAIVVGVLCTLLAAGVIVLGVAAMVQFQDAYEQMTDGLNRLRNFTP